MILKEKKKNSIPRKSKKILIFPPPTLPLHDSLINLSSRSPMCLLVWGYFRNLFRVGRQVRGLGVRYFRCVDHSPVVGQRCRGSVVQALTGHVNAVPFVFPVVIVVTGRGRCLGGFRRVSSQVDRFGVSHFRCVDHSPVVSQRRRWAVIRCPVGGVARPAGCCEDETRERELKTNNIIIIIIILLLLIDQMIFSISTPLSLLLFKYYPIISPRTNYGDNNRYP